MSFFLIIFFFQQRLGGVTESTLVFRNDGANKKRAVVIEKHTRRRRQSRDSAVNRLMKRVSSLRRRLGRRAVGELESRRIIGRMTKLGRSRSTLSIGRFFFCFHPPSSLSLSSSLSLFLSFFFGNSSIRSVSAEGRPNTPLFFSTLSLSLSLSVCVCV